MKPPLIGATILLLVLPSSGPGGESARRLPFESHTTPTVEGQIDKLVFARLRQLGIEPSPLCADSVFVRRVFLDVIGTLPTAQEARRFLASKETDKRRALVDRLLERDEFADYWSMKWGDLLRVKAEFPINLWPNAVQAYHRWIRTAIRENMPYDQFVRELLTASGSNFRSPQVNFYRAVQSSDPDALARAVALTFLGARIDRWPSDRQSGMKVFFSRIGYKRTAEWKEEIVFFDSLNGGGKPLGPAIFPDGTSVDIDPDADPRQVFVDWLITPENPWFARNIVNRIWSWLLGRGIIHQVDDIREDNPPENLQLLAWLEQELVGSEYDLKHIYREILNSNTYQLSSVPRSNHPDGAGHFATYPLRRLDAEVLIDAICQVTGTTEEYSSLIPEPFTFIPKGTRAIALDDGSTTSSFLDMFGRPPRDTGLESERNNRPTAAQRLHLLNSSHIRKKIELGPALRQLVRARRPLRKIMEQLYLTVLSRYPTEDEVRIVRGYLQSVGGKRREAVVDLMWALINSDEFLYRH